MSDGRDHTLSQAFMRAHPAQAAAVLEALPVDEAAALFERTPARVAAAVLAAMLPRAAARCVAALDEARAHELLAPMGTQPTVAVLRHVPDARRRTLINGLPTTAALASSLLLGYAEDTLGAWADPDVATLGADTRVGDALERLRQAPMGHALVFVTTAEHRLVGMVGLPALLRAPAAATLATLMSRPEAVLTAHAPVAGTAEHPGWMSTSLLPVVEPGGRLVGALSRDALARAVQRGGSPAPGELPTTLPGLLGRGCWLALSGLIGTGLALLPAVPAVLGDGDGR